MYGHIEDVLQRPLEFISDDEPVRIAERRSPAPGGFCWMGFEVWEAYGIPREKTCELCVQQKRQKTACLTLEAIA